MPGGSSPAGNTTTTTTNNNTPWGPEQGDLEQVLGSASSLYTNNPLGPSYYPGATYAPLNSTETSALGSMYNTGMTGTGALNGAEQGGAWIGSGGALAPSLGAYANANNSLASLSNTSNLDPNSNPYLKQEEQNTIAQTLPAIQGSFNAGGRSDSGLAASASSSGLASALGNLNYGQYNTDVGQALQADQISSGNYNSGVSAMNTAGLTAPGLNNATLGGQQAAFGAGQAQQTDAQNQIQADMNRYDYQQAQPYNGLAMYEQELGASGAGQYGQSTGTQTSPYFQNTFANVGAGLAGVGGLIGGLGLAGGSGGISSLFNWSDRRLKTDIHKIGKADNGLAIYAYRYKGTQTPQIGFMADEVRALRPDAVVRHPSGFDAVDYARAAA